MSTSSRPVSAMGNLGGSRPTTPSYSRPGTPSAGYARVEAYTGTISVSIRPNPKSVTNESGHNWEIDSRENTIRNTSDGTCFPFDNVFDANEELTNKHVYDRCCYGVVEKVLNEGYNGTVFAYGMTGSGKTFSIKGVEGDPGFVELAINDIFEKIDNGDGNGLMKYDIGVSYLEIYNEKIIDLLNSNAGTGGPPTGELKIRDDPEFGIKVIGLSSPSITSKSQLLELIRKGDLNRKTSATDFNARSSRSHSILQIKITSTSLISNTSTKATLSLCDLAGSERASTSVERRKEGSYINKSLLALSNVINRLSSSSLEHVPYRDSKLTRILQPALSGSSLVSILCTIHMGNMSGETYKTLRFAARAKDIVISVERNKSTRVNGGADAKMIMELQQVINQQRQELDVLRHSQRSISEGGGDSYRVNELEAENKTLREKIDHLTRLTDLSQTETIIVKNDVLNDILGSSGLDNPQIVMANIEDFYKRVQYEVNEYRSYISQLENQLKLTHQMNNLTENSTNNLGNDEIQQLLTDQEEEIYQLKEQLKDKDQIIKGLSKTSRLRQLVDSSNIMNHHHHNHNNNYDTSMIDSKRSSNLFSRVMIDKENIEPELREFKISPKKSKPVKDNILMNNTSNNIMI
ncbi:KIP2 [[Candida] subhashii]|uniref:Kinesin-like protein n=1 Tax=[Candida] subhashii TaxID=561895 RepID=A0A8J5QKT4_9ASCO|nr:KIP2 [[Candida] subhashii]KAG7662273.1 KIP2 [[Candida] subhashii]